MLTQRRWLAIISGMNPSNRKATVTPINQAKPPANALSKAKALMGAEIASVNNEIRSQLSSDIALINTLGEHIIQSGGKRLRPLVLLLSARALNYTGQQHISLAAVIEFIHTATLLHDDVVDASAMRRGKQTANDIWGNEASVLVGDFLYSRAFEMMVAVDSMPVMSVMARTTNTIAEGEVMQLLNAHDAYTSESAYLETIYRKSACLFESAAQLGGLVSGAGKAQIEALQTYGKHLGNAFQIMDDILDYRSDSSKMGKNSGDDLAEGKTTLPLIEAMRRGNNKQQAVIIDAIENGRRTQLTAILKIIAQTGALDYAYKHAQQQVTAAQQALQLLPESPFRAVLHELADFSIQRQY